MTGKKIKIALCLSGEPRSSMASFPYIYESLISSNPNYITDVYIHTWKNFRALPLYNPKNYKIDLINQNQFFIKFIDNLKIKGDIGEFLNEIFNRRDYTNNNQFLKNTILMHSSINRCFNLISEPYDIVIRCRLDVYFKQKFTIDYIILDLLNKKYDVFIPYDFSYGPRKNTLSDQIAIGNFETMKYYCNLIYNLENLIIKTQDIAPHSLLYDYLYEKNLKINGSFLDNNIIRQSNLYFDNPNYLYLDQ